MLRACLDFRFLKVTVVIVFSFFLKKNIFFFYLGHYLIGIQSNAELFVWFKDKDILKTIPGLEGVVALESLRTGKKLKIQKDNFIPCMH